MFARTPRLLLRPGFAEDARAFSVAIGDEAILRNIGSAPCPYDDADARAFLSAPSDPLLPGFVITQRTGGAPRIVGHIGITRQPDEDGPELGYWIARPFWGLGFATEAGRAVMNLARALKLPPLRAGHFTDNPASGAVLRKLGFRPTGQVVQRHSVARGEAAACVLFEEKAEAAGAADMGMSMGVGKRCRIGTDRDLRQELRQIAA